MNNSRGTPSDSAKVPYAICGSSSGHRNMLIVKVSLLLISAGVLLVGLLARSEDLAIAGACIYLLKLLIDLAAEYRRAKFFRAGRWKPNQTRRLLDVAAVRLQQGMTLTGLVLAVLEYNSGLIIWAGSAITWFIAGVIAQNVAGIPLRMGYGGWH